MSIRSLSKVDNELLTRIDEVLHYLWDPIGVSDMPAARDEYSSYASVVFGMLKRDESAEEISRYLREIRVVNMGIGRLDDRSNEDQIAGLVIGWKERLFEE